MEVYLLVMSIYIIGSKISVEKTGVVDIYGNNIPFIVIAIGYYYYISTLNCNRALSFQTQIIFKAF